MTTTAHHLSFLVAAFERQGTQAKAAFELLPSRRGSPGTAHQRVTSTMLEEFTNAQLDSANCPSLVGNCAAIVGYNQEKSRHRGRAQVRPLWWR